VAVLDIHIDSNAETIKSASAVVWKWPRPSYMMRDASQRSSSCRESAAARPNPPKNRKISGWAKPKKLWPTSIVPVRADTTGMSMAMIGFYGT